MQVKVETVKGVADEVFKHPGNPAAKMRHAVRIANIMRRECVDFAVIADAFALWASWEGKRVVVDDVQWIPPLVPDGDVQ